MSTLHLKFYSCLRLQSPDVEINPGPRRPVAASCRILCSNVQDLSGNLGDLAVASSQYDILLCSETLVSDLCHVSELLVPGFGRPALLCPGKLPRACVMAAYVRDGYGAFCQPKFEYGCCEMLVLRVCFKTELLCVDDCIYHCLLTSMAALQAEDVHASFLFVGDLNGYHQEWLGSAMTNSHGVAAFDFMTVSVCGQLVVGPTYARGGILDLMIDVADFIRVAVVAPIGNSDHS